MRILMLGWEFPPFNSGGLGTACYGLTKALARNGIDILFVLPSIAGKANVEYMRILRAEEREFKGKVRFRAIDSLIKPYITSEGYGYEQDKGLYSRIYGADLFSEVMRYAQEVRAIAQKEEFDVIHCHDWLTMPAAIEVKKVALERGMNPPLIVHIHATEFDRTGGNPYQEVYELEKYGMDYADYIIAVSNYTRDMIVGHYSIDPRKIHVVHNAIDPEIPPEREEFPIKNHYRIVLFLGRMSLQKGPDHFLQIAKRISEIDDRVRFIMVGSGDMFFRIVEESANLGIGDKVLFTDFLRGRDVERAYQMADVYVLPSVSEPFGITPLEAMRNGTPVVISKQSGVSEILRNCLLADFWDVEQMTERILSLLGNEKLRKSLVEEGLKEIMNLSWDQPALKCISLYERALHS